MKRKALLIGGTGTISSAVTQLLSESEEWEVTLLNRGSKHDIPSHVISLLSRPNTLKKTFNSSQGARVSISLSVRLRPIVNRFRVRLSPSLHR